MFDVISDDDNDDDGKNFFEGAFCGMIRLLAA